MLLHECVALIHFIIFTIVFYNFVVSIVSHKFAFSYFHGAKKHFLIIWSQFNNIFDCFVKVTLCKKKFLLVIGGN